MLTTPFFALLAQQQSAPAASEPESMFMKFNNQPFVYNSLYYTGTFAAGASDFMTFGLTKKINDMDGGSSSIGYDSGTYTAGKVTGIGLTVATAVAGGATGAALADGKTGGYLCYGFQWASWWGLHPIWMGMEPKHRCGWRRHYSSRDWSGARCSMVESHNFLDRQMTGGKMNTSSDPTMTYDEVADTLQAFVDGSSGQWDWDNYMSATFFTDPYLRDVQQRMIHLSEEFPAKKGEGFCGAEGLAVIRAYVQELRANASELSRGER